jgi:hypothetical protein
MSFDIAKPRIMNKVSALKNQFEKLNSEVVESLDITPLRSNRGPITKFHRSATCIDFSKLKVDEVPKQQEKSVTEVKKNFEFQRQLSNSSTSPYKSIRRSPAFRFDAQNRPSVVKNVTKEVPVKNITREIPVPVKKRTEFDELEYLSTSATIKKALAKPLPTGSPPKKPPRLFQSPQLNKKDPSPEPVQNRFEKLKITSNTLPKKASKTEEKKAISSFLNCIISPCSIDPIYYEQIKLERKRIQDAEETIYMEPFAHLKKDFMNNMESPPKQKEELHYMCTVLDPSQPSDMNGNTSNNNIQKDYKRSSLESSEAHDYDKVNFSKLRKMFK